MRGSKSFSVCALALMINGAFALHLNPSQISFICSDEDSDLIFRHEECNKYYQCSYGKAEEHTCPQNLVYNHEKRYCDWAENVDCEVRIPEIPEVPGVDEPGNNNGSNGDPSLAEEICSEEGSDGTLVAHEECNKFYMCSEGRPAAINCPLNLLYNPEKEQCDWPENVDCDGRSPGTPGNPDDNDNNNNGGGNSDPSKAPEICAEEGSDGVLIAHEDCNKFYKCAEGKPGVIDCPLNLLYNPEKEQCDWPENVVCDSRNPGASEVDKNGNVNGDSSDPSQAVEICATEGSDGKLIAHEECNKFYMCSEGRPAAISCPLNLFYNPETEQCDWAENVDCEGRAPGTPGIPDVDENENNNNGGPNTDPSEAPEICAEEGSDGILIAHEECNKFYMCSEGRPAEIECPLNLLYNAEKEYCDWPENVTCN